VREKLLEILAEPKTGAVLRLEGATGRGARIESGCLVSDETGKSYPIVRGIPRFVESDDYTSSFGMQWNRFRGVQVDSVTGASYSQARLEAETGWSADELGGKWLLDAGCGAGRFAEVAASRHAEVVALDFSSAVEAASKTLERFPNADVVQGNLLEPPFREASFDFAYCIGVVQHTPDPPAVVANVVRCVRPDGRFAFSIYARQPWTKLNTKYLLRPLTRRLSQPSLLRAIESAMPVLFPLMDSLLRVPLLGKIARFTIPVATYVDRDQFSREQRYQEAILDTFDMLSPRYDSPMRWNEVDVVLRRTGARAWHFRTRVPINVIGTR
jgi:SAM-dependent methyltransferase